MFSLSKEEGGNHDGDNFGAPEQASEQSHYQPSKQADYQAMKLCVKCDEYRTVANALKA